MENVVYIFLKMAGQSFWVKVILIVQNKCSPAILQTTILIALKAEQSTRTNLARSYKQMAERMHLNTLKIMTQDVKRYRDCRQIHNNLRKSLGITFLWNIWIILEWTKQSFFCGSDAQQILKPNKFYVNHLIEDFVHFFCTSTICKLIQFTPFSFAIFPT